MEVGKETYLKEQEIRRMARPKKKVKAYIDGYFYGCCPYCKTPLTQGKDGTDSYNLCPCCGTYIRVTIEGNKVIVEPKEDD